MQTTDVLVIGGGPAGSAAALAAARGGLGVTLVERGSPVHVAELGAAGVNVLSETIAWGLFEAGMVSINGPDGIDQIHAQRIVLAIGAHDLAWAIPGWELPQVQFASSVLGNGQPVGDAIAVIGSGGTADAVIAMLDAQGVKTQQIDPSTPGLEILSDSVRTEEGVIACDAVVMAIGRQPNVRLSLQATPILVYDANARMQVPERDQYASIDQGRTFLIGDAAGITSPVRAQLEGKWLGEMLCRSATTAQTHAELDAAPQIFQPFPGVPEIADTTCICRCERIAAAQVRAAISSGAQTLNDVKRMTRAGMGACQGVLCNPMVAALIVESGQAEQADIQPMTSRPPVVPISMAALADA